MVFESRLDREEEADMPSQLCSNWGREEQAETMRRLLGQGCRNDQFPFDK